MRERYVDVDGHRIRYFEGGDPDKGTLVMLHGLGGSAERWSNVGSILEGRLRVVIPDMIGFGLSDKPEADYTPEFFSSFVDKFVRSTCRQRIYLAGSSLGGQVAAVYAASHPASIGKLILVSPSGMMRSSTPALDAYVMAAMYPSEQSVAEAFATMEASGEAPDDALVRRFLKFMKQPNAKMAFMSTLLGLKNNRLDESTLRSIDHETLLVWGADDPVIPIRNAGYFASAIRNCTLFRMDDCGHTPYVQRPQEFAGRVLDFLLS